MGNRATRGDQDLLEQVWFISVSEERDEEAHNDDDDVKSCHEFSLARVKQYSKSLCLLLTTASKHNQQNSKRTWNFFVLCLMINNKNINKKIKNKSEQLWFSSSSYRFARFIMFLIRTRKNFGSMGSSKIATP